MRRSAAIRAGTRVASTRTSSASRSRRRPDQDGREGMRPRV
jgi:hypothetical protein